MTKEEELLYDNTIVNNKIKDTMKKVFDGKVSVEVIDELDIRLSTNFTKIEDVMDDDNTNKLVYKIDRRKNESSVRANIKQAVDSIKDKCFGIGQEYILDMKAGETYIELTPKIR